MRKSLIFLGGLLAIGTIPTALTPVSNAQVRPLGALPPPVTAASPSVGAVIDTFNCRILGVPTKVAIRSDHTYKTGTSAYPIVSGAYQKFGDAYRFKGGSLRNQSIVRLRSSYYLVATTQETRAAAIAATDRALVCTKQR
jgi:hypothetical protein